MTFLELVKAVRSRVGMQGSGPASVLTATSAEMDLVNSVHDAWIDIQNFRDEWNWMRSTVQFNTVASVDTYSLQDILGINYRHKNWKKSPAYILANGQKSPLRYIEYDQFNYRNLNVTVPGIPSCYTIRPWDNAILIDLPDGVYSVYLDYYKSPQELVDNGDIPELPSHYHLLIVYAAVEKYDTVVVASESYQHYAQQHVIMLGQLMRNQLSKKRVKTEGIV